jgi:hypothetical protein
MNGNPLDTLESDENPSQAPAPFSAPAPMQAIPPAFDPRRRMRELLSIPERDRTDTEWDELNELEIQTAPGNRLGGQPPHGYAGKPSGGGSSGSGGPGVQSKNRFKGKPRKPGMGTSGGANRPPQAKQNKPPRPV